MTQINTAILRCCRRAGVLACLLLGLIVGAALPVWAEPLAVQRTYWIDASGMADITQVQQQTFLPAPDILALGYGAAPVWLRVTVPPSPRPELLVVVKPPVLDDVRLFIRPRLAPDAPSADAWEMRQQGDLVRFSAREREYLNFSFVIIPSPTEATTFYVRLSTTGSRTMSVSVSPVAEAAKNEELISLGIAVYLGLVLTLAVFSLIQTFINRDRLWALNTVVQVVMVVWALMYQGYPAKYISPDMPFWNDTGFNISYCIYMFLLFVYYREFAIAFRAPRWLVALLALTMLPLPWQLWAIWHGQTREALQVTSGLLLFRTFGGLFLVWFFVIEDRLLRYMVRFTHISQSVYGISQILPILGLTTMSEWHLYPAFLFNLYGATMQYLVLTRRDSLLRHEQSQLRRRIHDAEQQLGWEQRRLKESASFMAMLLHELKNPLASIRLATQTLLTGKVLTAQEQAQRLSNINQSIDGIDAVMERCRQVDRFEQGYWPTEKSPLDVSLLVAQCLDTLPQRQRIQADLPESLPALQDGNLLRTMTLNLLDNALAYSPPDSVVTVQLQLQAQGQDPQQQFTLTLRNAVGKAGAPDPQRVFSKYYRADKAHQRTGSGLGLFLVKGLAHLADGNITYRTETRSDGALLVVFELCLPCQ